MSKSKIWKAAATLAFQKEAEEVMSWDDLQGIYIIDFDGYKHNKETTEKRKKKTGALQKLLRDTDRNGRPALRYLTIMYELLILFF